MKCGSMTKKGNIWKFKNANNENSPEYNYKKIYKSFEEAIKKKKNIKNYCPIRNQ